jgi:hypothetical protein
MAERSGWSPRMNWIRFASDQTACAADRPSRFIMRVAMATARQRCGTFDTEEAIRLIVSTAARAGIPVELDSVISCLHTAFPDAAMTDTALRRELLKAADRAQIDVNCGTEASAFRSSEVGG